jgi:hypothetical protein
MLTLRTELHFDFRAMCQLFWSILAKLCIATQFLGEFPSGIFSEVRSAILYVLMYL